MPLVQIGNEMLGPIPILVFLDVAMFSPATFSISWWQIATGVWLAGVISFLAYHALKHYFFVKMVGRWSEKITDEQILTLFQGLKRERGITRKIELYRCSCAFSPMMIGFVHPKIILPPTTFTKNEFCFIFKHELAHHKRKDLLCKYLIFVATAVHWFNPVVYFMARTISELCEACCDAEVMWDADADTRQHYGETILGVVKYSSTLQTAFSTHFYENKKSIQKRLASIMDTNKKKAGNALICMVLVATICTGIVTATPVSTAGAVEDPHSEYANLVKYCNKNCDVPCIHQDQSVVDVPTCELMRTWGWRQKQNPECVICQW